MALSGKFKSVSLFAISPDEPLPFHLAIHFKGRYIIYRNPGEKLEVNKFNRFIYKRIGQVYVPDEEYTKFLEYQRVRQAEEQRELNDPSINAEQKAVAKTVLTIKRVTRDLFLTSAETQFEEKVREVIQVAHSAVEQALARPYARIFESLPEKSSDIITHSMRLSLLAPYLGYQLGYVNPVSLEYLAAAALLHDVGKTQLPLLDVLDVSEEEEVEIMKQHPNVSCKMIQDMSFVPDEVLTIIREHHEARDGSGYPNGIRGPKIHALSKIFSIANAFDGLVTELTGNRDERYAQALKIMSINRRNEFDATMMPKAVKILGQKTQLTVI